MAPVLLHFLTSAHLATISGTPDAISLGTESGGCRNGVRPRMAGTGLDPAWPAGGYTPGRSEKLGRVSRNSRRGSREKSGEAELGLHKATYILHSLEKLKSENL